MRPDLGLRLSVCPSVLTRPTARTERYFSMRFFFLDHNSRLVGAFYVFGPVRHLVGLASVKNRFFEKIFFQDFDVFRLVMMKKQF